MALNCFKCGAEVVFDSDHIGKNGKKIPLDPATHTPHDCPMRQREPISPVDFKEDKDDHGNEQVSGFGVGKNRAFDLPEGKTPEFVDHTAKGQSKVKIFLSEIPQILEKEYNEFLAENNGKIKTQGAQFHISDRPMFAIALYYEETK